MNTDDRKIRLMGITAFAMLFFLFWHLFIFATPQKAVLLLLGKTLLSSLVFAITTWEPVRWVILTARKQWPLQSQNVKRKIIVASILLPMGIILSLGRTLLEHHFFWRMPFTEWSFMIPMFGVTTLFILVEVAVYEAYFFVVEWMRSKSELEELKKTNLQVQFDTLKLQIQPHFLFNTLNTLVGLIELDPPRARVFTEEMAYVYRYLLSANETQFVDLQDELKFTRAYYYLLKTRYPEGLYMEVEYTGDSGEPFQVPPLTLQILLENAVKHNVVTRANPLYISLRIDSEREEVVVKNNLQRKDEFQRIGLGLKHLHKKFELSGLREVRIREDKDHFTVTIPLIKSGKYESADH